MLKNLACVGGKLESIVRKWGGVGDPIRTRVKMADLNRQGKQIPESLKKGKTGGERGVRILGGSGVC